MNDQLNKEQLEQVKEEHPGWFNTFKKDTWYIYNDLLFMFNGEYDYEGDPCGYGFSSAGWSNNNEGWNKNFEWKRATPKEKLERFLQEIKERYKNANFIISIDNPNHLINFVVDKTAIVDYINNNKLFFHAYWDKILIIKNKELHPFLLYSAGEWAKFDEDCHIETSFEENVSNVLDVLKKSYPQYEYELRVKEKYLGNGSRTITYKR